MADMNGFKEVSKTDRCPICGKSDWCSVSRDGTVICCRRDYGSGGIPKNDRSGTPYWLHFKNEPAANSAPPHSKEKDRPRANADVLNEVYKELLREFSLHDPHRRNLLERGLSDGEINRRGYGSLSGKKRWESATRIVEKYGKEVCLGVPGLLLKNGESQSYWTVSGMPGILIPVRDMQERIIALKIRLDEPNDSGKYRYLSSKLHGGPGAGTHVHIPLYAEEIGAIVQVTEGELKADIATALQQQLTLSIPGVASWRMALPILKILSPQTVSIAFDSDAKTNVTVANCLEQFAWEIRRQGYGLQIVQ